MDRDAITAPAMLDWHALTPQRQRAEALALIERAINAIVSDGREPDFWEGPKLMEALSLVFIRWYWAARQRALHALLPPEPGAEAPQLPDGADTPTIRTLRGLADTLRQLGHLNN